MKKLTVLYKKIAQLQQEAAFLEANQEEQQLRIQNRKRKAAINRVETLMNRLGVTLEDLSDVVWCEQPQTRAPVQVKFRHPNGHTWTGRGKPPRWLAEAEASGTNRETFRIAA
jgi:DNA-binding protein H-NS